MGKTALCKAIIPGYNSVMDSSTKQPAKPRRRWFRFRRRTLLLIVVTILSVPLGWVGWELNEVRKERTVIAWIEKTGGSVNYDSQNGQGTRSSWEETTEKWFGERVRWVRLYGHEGIDLSPLTEFKKLSMLSLGQSERTDPSLNVPQVIDLSPLAEVRNLDTLWIDNTIVKDLSPLTKLKGLKSLVLRLSQVSNLSPLSELKSIENLHISKTSLKDLTPLGELKNLKSLDLAYVQITDLSPLAKLKNLKRLRFYNAKVSNAQVQELRQALPNCEIANDSISAGSFIVY